MKGLHILLHNPFRIFWFIHQFRIIVFINIRYIILGKLMLVNSIIHVWQFFQFRRFEKTSPSTRIQTGILCLTWLGFTVWTTDNIFQVWIHLSWHAQHIHQNQALRLLDCICYMVIGNCRIPPSIYDVIEIIFQVAWNIRLYYFRLFQKI